MTIIINHHLIMLSVKGLCACLIHMESQCFILNLDGISEGQNLYIIMEYVQGTCSCKI